MDSKQVIERLRATPNRAAVARATGLKYMHLSRIAWGDVKDPGSSIIDTLRAYYEAHPTEGLPQ